MRMLNKGKRYWYLVCILVVAGVMIYSFIDISSSNKTSISTKSPIRIPNNGLSNYDRKVPQSGQLLIQTDRTAEEILLQGLDQKYTIRYFMLENLDSLFYLLDTMDLCNPQWFDELDTFIKHIEMQNNIFQSANDKAFQEVNELHHNLCIAMKTYRDKQDIYTANAVEEATKNYRSYYFSLVEGGRIDETEKMEL